MSMSTLGKYVNHSPHNSKFTAGGIKTSQIRGIGANVQDERFETDE